MKGKKCVICGKGRIKMMLGLLPSGKPVPVHLKCLNDLDKCRFKQRGKDCKVKGKKYNLVLCEPHKKLLEKFSPKLKRVM